MGLVITEWIARFAYRFTYISFTIASSAYDRRTYIYAPARRPREKGRSAKSPFILRPGSEADTHSPFSLISDRQVTASAANGKLKRVKIRGGADRFWNEKDDVLPSLIMPLSTAKSHYIVGSSWKEIKVSGFVSLRHDFGSFSGSR